MQRLRGKIPAREKGVRDHKAAGKSLEHETCLGAPSRFQSPFYLLVCLHLACFRRSEIRLSREDDEIACEKRKINTGTVRAVCLPFGLEPSPVWQLM